ncbi:MAG: hypothetical protein FRX49_12489 [Trebouxia sp. A1-2]|nr:MAG: hypothetical protein FRX49_12489 [Trebouxia sp. A1-2]
MAACNSDPFCLYLAWVNIDISIAHPNLVITLLSILEDGWSDAKLCVGTHYESTAGRGTESQSLISWDPAVILNLVDL